MQVEAKLNKPKAKPLDYKAKKDGFMLELNCYERNSPYNTEYTVGEGLDHLAFKVDDLDKALDEARKAGRRTILEMKANGSRWAYIEDPDGIWIELFS